jgi:hypothetical protein
MTSRTSALFAGVSPPNETGLRRVEVSDGLSFIPWLVLAETGNGVEVGSVVSTTE